MLVPEPQVDHYHKTPLQQLRALEKTATGLKVFLSEQDGCAAFRRPLMFVGCAFRGPPSVSSASFHFTFAALTAIVAIAISTVS